MLSKLRRLRPIPAGTIVRVVRIHPGDTFPAHRVGQCEYLVTDLEESTTYRGWYTLYKGGSQDGTWCRVEVADPAEQAAWRLAGGK